MKDFADAQSLADARDFTDAQSTPVNRERVPTILALIFLVKLGVIYRIAS